MVKLPEGSRITGHVWGMSVLPMLIDTIRRLPKALLEALNEAIAKKRSNSILPAEDIYSRMKEIYTWQNVAARTEKVYDSIANDPTADLAERLERLCHCGPFAGIFIIFLAVINHLIYLFLEWMVPRKDIDIAVDLLHPSFESNQRDLSNVQSTSSKQLPCEQESTTVEYELPRLRPRKK